MITGSRRQGRIVRELLIVYGSGSCWSFEKAGGRCWCCAWVCVKLDTNNRNEETHFLFIAMIDVTSKDWCPIQALLVIAQAQKPGATHNKGGLQFGNTNTRGKTPTTACLFMEHLPGRKSISYLLW